MVIMIMIIMTIIVLRYYCNIFGAWDAYSIIWCAGCVFNNYGIIVTFLVRGMRIIIFIITIIILHKMCM